MPSALSREQLIHLAKLGAGLRLSEIKRERAALNAIVNGNASGAGQMQTPGAERVRRRSRRRVTWTAAQRMAVSERMKRYWAARRAGRKK
jgi:hypothetical protein